MAVWRRIWVYFSSWWLVSRRTYTFEERFGHARDLLDFAVTEGADIDEWVIDQIDGAELETVDRVQFDKAYRRLAEQISPVTWSSLRFSSLSKLELLGIAFILAIFVWAIQEKSGFVDLVGATGGIFLLMWFLDIFTGIVTKKRMIEIVVFCYLFTFAAVLGPMVIFFAAFSWNPALEDFMRTNPMGLVRGCSVQKRPGWVPEEIQCGQDTERPDVFQWVLNIGGTIPAAAAPDSMKAVEGSEEGQDTSDRQTETAADMGGASTGTDEVETRGDRSGQQPSSVARIEGGVVVPLYVIVLALMGGAVSMTRRVPEYQRRVYLPHSDPEHITRERGRELLVFQIMQVLSAPLIAVAAYYMIKPTDITVSVLLGFASGFASETILLAIRALVTKLNPSTGVGNTQRSNA